MKALKKHLITALIVALPVTVSASSAKPEIPEKHAEARSIVKEFGGMLQPELGKAMKGGGPAHAVGTCHEISPEISETLSAKTGWDINRVSLKPRATTANADSWETETLNWFEAQLADGQDIATLEKFEIVKLDGQETIRYMKAVPTAEVCLTCHGESIPQGVTEKLSELYPTDTATNYKLGQIRGAFSFKQAVN